MSADLNWCEAEIRVLKRELAGLRRLVIEQQTRIDTLEQNSPTSLAVKSADRLVELGLLEKRE